MKFWTTSAAWSLPTRLTSLIICARRVATSAYKPARLGKSLLLGLSRRSGQPYPLVADRPASHP